MTVSFIKIWSAFIEQFTNNFILACTLKTIKISAYANQTLSEWNFTAVYIQIEFVKKLIDNFGVLMKFFNPHSTKMC